MVNSPPLPVCVIYVLVMLKDLYITGSTQQITPTHPQLCRYVDFIIVIHLGDKKYMKPRHVIFNNVAF